MEPFLTKYPLVFFEKGDLQYNSHFSYPFYKNFETELELVLLHYKFLKNDLEKIVKDKNYALGSKQYQIYLKAFEDNPNINFKDKKSVKYNNSKDLKKITIYNPIKWN